MNCRLVLLLSLCLAFAAGGPQPSNIDDLKKVGRRKLVAET
jgi:hypothetical protein